MNVKHQLDTCERLNNRGCLFQFYINFKMLLTYLQYRLLTLDLVIVYRKRCRCFSSKCELFNGSLNQKYSSFKKMFWPPATSAPSFDSVENPIQERIEYVSKSTTYYISLGFLYLHLPFLAFLSILSGRLYSPSSGKLAILLQMKKQKGFFDFCNSCF